MGKLLACCICLVTDVRLYELKKHGLKDLYETLAGYTILENSSVLFTCSICALTLRKFGAFRKTCTESLEFLMETGSDGIVMTKEFLKSITGSINFSPYRINKVAVINIPSSSSYQTHSIDKDNKDQTIDYESESDGEPQYLMPFETEDDNKDEDILNEQLSFFKEYDKNNFKITVTESNAGKETDEETSFFDENVEMENSGDEDGYKQKDDTNSWEIIRLSKEEQMVEFNARRNAKSYRISVHQCHLCLRGFQGDTSFKDHMAKHDPKKFGKYICDICKLCYREKRTLKVHKTGAHEKKYACKKCSYTSMSETKAQLHKRLHTGSPYKCQMCDASYMNSSSYFTHLRTQHPSRCICDYCGETFVTERGLKIHKYKMHWDIIWGASYNCTKCKLEFTNPEALTKHTELTHLLLRPVDGRPCAVCGENFSTQELFVEHFKTAHKKPDSKCRLCDKAFLTERNKMKHMELRHGLPRNLHSELKLEDEVVKVTANDACTETEYVPEYVCEQCGKKFLTKGNLTSHQLNHWDEKEKQYVCPHCGRRYAVEYHLRSHMRSHTGDRPFRCRHCKRSFTNERDLTAHEMVHTGAKPYSCPVCERSFSRTSAMNNHLKIHNKIKPKVIKIERS